MKFRTNREVTWISLELSGLLEDEESHVHFTRTTKHLALHPYHLNNVQRGVNEILRSSLNTYDKELKGFVLAFRNPKLLSRLGEILYDSPFIHIDVEADFYLFRPTVGAFLKGIVNKKGLDHIVVLVHKVYTVSIPKPDDTKEWPGESVEIGQEVKCCVSRIDNKSKPPFICATLRYDYSQGCRLSLNNTDNVGSANESVSEKEKKKHQKKRKKSRGNDTELVCKVENESESHDNVGNDTSVTVKSEKKLQYQSLQDTKMNTDNSVNNSDVDNVPKKHKKSKKMSKSLVNNDTTLDEHTELRKAVKRENSVPLDSIIETETKKRKKHAKKSEEFDLETVSVKTESKEKIICKTDDTISKYIKSEKKEQLTETETKKKKKHAKKSKEFDSETVVTKIESKEEIICDTENTIPRYIKSEKEEQLTETETKKKKKHAKKSKESETVVTKTECKEEIICDTEDIPRYIKSEKEEHKKSIIVNADLSLSSLEDSVIKKHKKNKKPPIKMSDSELEGHVRIKIEKQDPFVDGITNERSESQVSGNKTRVTENLNENFKMPKVKREDSVKSEKQKKSPKKHTVTSRDLPLKFIKIKNLDDLR